MTSGITPGEWVACIEGVNQQGAEGHTICAGQHMACVATVPLASSASTAGEDGETVISPEEAIANTHAIAALPALIAALRRIADRDLTYFDGCVAGGHFTMEDIAAAREALAAALPEPAPPVVIERAPPGALI